MYTHLMCMLHMDHQTVVEEVLVDVWKSHMAVDPLVCVIPCPSHDCCNNCQNLYVYSKTIYNVARLVRVKWGDES